MSAPGTLYLDSSAIVKLVALEPESGALLDLVKAGGPAVSSALATVEVLRAVNRLDRRATLQEKAAEVLHGIAMIKMDEAILRQAAHLRPASLRSLDAIHLATALSVQQHLEAFVVYDEGLTEAAVQLGLAVAAPN